MHFANLTLRGFETKSVSDDRATFSGVASTGDLDANFDIVEPGAFGKSIGHVVLLRDHFPSKVIGKVNQFEQDGKDLRVAGEIGFDTDTARETYALMKRGYLTGVSPGFVIKRGGAEIDTKTGIRRIKNATLHELSIVAMPANGMARLHNVKSLLQQLGPRDFLFDLGFEDDDAEVIIAKGLDALLRGEGRSSPAFLPPPPPVVEDDPPWVADVRNMLKDLRSRHVD